MVDAETELAEFEFVYKGLNNDADKGLANLIYDFYAFLGY